MRVWCKYLAQEHPSSQAAAAKACTSVAGNRPSAKQCSKRRAKADAITRRPTAPAKDEWSHKSADGCVLVCLSLCSSALRRLYRTPASADPIGDTEARIGRFARRKEATRTDTNNTNRGGVGGDLGNLQRWRKCVRDGRERRLVARLRKPGEWRRSDTRCLLLFVLGTRQKGVTLRFPFISRRASKWDFILRQWSSCRTRQDQQSRTAKPGSHVCSTKVCLAQGALQEPPQTSEVFGIRPSSLAGDVPQTSSAPPCRNSTLRTCGPHPFVLFPASSSQYSRLGHPPKNPLARHTSRLVRAAPPPAVDRSGATEAGATAARGMTGGAENEDLACGDRVRRPRHGDAFPEAIERL